VKSGDKWWPMILTGSFVRTIDEKLRVAIPKELRDAAKLSPGGVVYAAPGTDGSLALYTEQGFEDLAARMGALSPTAQDARDFNRLFFAQARRLELDGQSRVRIPAELVAHAALRKEALLLGVKDHMELWDQERWNAYLQDKSPRYDAIAEAAFAQDQAAK
jgi:MraZ protein